MALADYFSEAGEAALGRAEDIGREAAAGGLSLSELGAVHHAALAHWGATSGASTSELLARGGVFFGRCLGPFETAALAASRELESVSYSMAHDLRGPLRSMDGFSQALLEDCGPALGEQARRQLGNVRQAAQRMAQLLDALLGLVKLSRAELRPSAVDLSALAREIVDAFARREPDRRVAVEIASGLQAYADARLLRSLLRHLLGNAWKFTRGRELGHIELGRASELGAGVFFVRDNGAGFDMAHYAKLFGIFETLHSAREFQGLGVGLATVQRIVDKHGGRIWAEGAVDGGATFHFTLGAPEKEA